MECQVKSTKIAHSNPETDPEMFRVIGKGSPATISVQCLAHAIQSERQGYQTDVICPKS